MEIDLYSEEIVELIKIHRSAAVHAAQAGDVDKAEFHEARAKHLSEISGLPLDGA